MATESIIVSVRDKKFSFESQVASIGKYLPTYFPT